MAKLTLNDIVGGVGTAEAHNVNYALIEAAMENTVSRDGTSPNTMLADLDFNSYNVNNVGILRATRMYLDGNEIDIRPYAASTLESLTDVTISATTNRWALMADGSDWHARALVEADISDLGAYLTAEVNDLSSAVTWANIPDANVPVSAVTQHQASLSITESQISDLAAGLVVNYAATSDGAVNTGTTLMPLDDTIPQNTEGDEYMTLSITPTDADNLLEIEAVGNFSHSAAGRWLLMALFQDSDADALAVAPNYAGANTEIPGQNYIKYVMTAGDH